MEDENLVRLKDSIGNKIKEIDIPNSVNRNQLSQIGSQLLVFEDEIKRTCVNNQECMKPYFQEINNAITLINSRIDYLNNYFSDFKKQVETETNFTFLKGLKEHFALEKQKLLYKNSKNITSAEYAELETYINLIDTRLKYLNASGGKKRKLVNKRKTVKRNSKKRKTFKKK